MNPFQQLKFIARLLSAKYGNLWVVAIFSLLPLQIMLWDFYVNASLQHVNMFILGYVLLMGSFVIAPIIEDALRGETLANKNKNTRSLLFLFQFLGLIAATIFLWKGVNFTYGYALFIVGITTLMWTMIRQLTHSLAGLLSRIMSLLILIPTIIFLLYNFLPVSWPCGWVGQYYLESGCVRSINKNPRTTITTFIDSQSGDPYLVRPMGQSVILEPLEQNQSPQERTFYFHDAPVRTAFVDDESSRLIIVHLGFLQTEDSLLPDFITHFTEVDLQSHTVLSHWQTTPQTPSIPGLFVPSEESASTSESSKPTISIFNPELNMQIVYFEDRNEIEGWQFYESIDDSQSNQMQKRYTRQANYEDFASQAVKNFSILPEEKAMCITFIPPDRNRFLVGNSEGIFIYDTVTGELRLMNNSFSTYTCNMTPDGDLLTSATALEDQNIQTNLILVDLDQGKQVGIIKHEHILPISFDLIRFTPDSRYILFDMGSELLIYDLSQIVVKTD